MGNSPGAYVPKEYPYRESILAKLKKAAKDYPISKDIEDRRHEDPIEARRYPPVWGPQPSIFPPPPSMKKGGMIRKTGLYRLHAGEKVSLARRYREAKHG